MSDTTNINEATSNAVQQQNPAPTPTEAVNSGSHPSATLTQEQFSKGIGEARKEGKTTAIADLLKKWGASSLEEVESRIAKAAEIEKSKMTETEKLQAERDKVAKERDDAIAERDRIKAERRNDKIASYLQTEAGKMKATDAETVLLYAQQKHQDALNAIMAEDGTLDETKAKKLLETIKAEKPVYFVAVLPGAGVPSNSGGRATPQMKPVDTSKFRI